MNIKKEITRLEDEIKELVRLGAEVPSEFLVSLYLLRALDELGTMDYE